MVGPSSSQVTLSLGLEAVACLFPLQKRTSTGLEPIFSGKEVGQEPSTVDVNVLQINTIDITENIHNNNDNVKDTIAGPSELFSPKALIKKIGSS